jgi:acetylornithine deacetylase/succinyl-diaminopimelate desuccinylase-like protein
LARAVQRLAEWQRPMIFTPETVAYVDRLADAGLLPPMSERGALESAIRGSRPLLAMFMNTLNVTMLQAGIKANVIPGRSEAVVDCRLLPGHSRDEWREAVIERIGDPNVSVDFHEDLDPDEPVAVEWDTELYRVIESVVRDAVEDAIVVPGMTVGGTDNRFLRQRGIPAYGFAPCILSSEERAGFHGNDEYLTIDNLNLGCELTFEIVRRMCT